MEKRVRSPNYPAISLPEAISRVGALYKTQHTHSAPREIVAKGMGYAGLNGASATAVSALVKYGLLDRDKDELRVSDRAMRILHPHTPEERSGAIREAAYDPPLFSELLERFPGQLPSEDILRNYLVRKGFAEAALSPVISAYRETSEMVGREGGAYDLSVAETEEPHSMQTIPNQPPIGGPARPMINMQSIEKFGDERSIGRYDFEGGSYVRIAASEGLETETALDMVEVLIELKRKELARKKVSTISTPPVDNQNGKDED